MGLADDLFKFSGTGLAAGLGQGLANGVQNYSQGLERQAELDLRRQDAAQRQRAADQQYYTAQLQLVKELGQNRLAAGDARGAAGLVGQATDLTNKLVPGLGLAAPVVKPTTTPAQPPHLVTPMGPMWNGDAMGVMGPATPERQDWNTPEVESAVRSGLGLAAPKWEHAAGGGILYRQRPDGTVDYKELPNPYKMTVDDQFRALDLKGQQALTRGQQRDQSRMALEQFKQSQVGQRFLTALKSREYLAEARKDPAKHYATIVAMAKTLAGPRDMTDIDGAQQAAKIQNLVEQMMADPRFSVTAPGDTPQGGSPSGQPPFPRK